MAGKTKTKTSFWLHELQSNWLESKHFIIDGENLHDELWLMCDPRSDPREVKCVEELDIVVCNSNCVIPTCNFRAKAWHHQLLLSGVLDDKRREILFVKSRAYQHVFIAQLDHAMVSLDTKRRLDNSFLSPFDENENCPNEGDKIAFMGYLWYFVKWSEEESSHVYLQRHDGDGHLLTRIAHCHKCLKVDDKVSTYSRINSLRW